MMKVLNKSLRAVLIVYLVYLALSILLLTPALHFGLAPVYKEQTGREITYRFIYFNPFALSVNGSELADRNEDDSLFWGVEKLSLNISLQSIAGKLAFDQIALSGLELHPFIDSQGVWNFEQILRYREQHYPSGEASTGEEKIDEPGLEIVIDDFSLTGKRFAFSDFSRPQQFLFELDEVDLSLRDFSTIAAGGRPYQLAIRHHDGGLLQLDGLFSLADANADVRFELDCLHLEPFWRYLSADYDIDLKGGCVSTQGRVLLDWADVLDYKLDVATLAIEDMALSRLSSSGEKDNDFIGFSQLLLQQITLDATSRELDIASLSVEGLSVHGSSEGGQTGFHSLFKTGSGSTPTPHQHVSAETENDAPALGIHVAKVAVNDGAVFWQASELGEQSLAISSLYLSLSEIRWPSDSPLLFSLEAAINTDTRLAVKGEAILNAPAVRAELAVNRLPLGWFNPLLANHVHARVNQGELDLDTRINFSSAENLRVEVDGGIRDFNATRAEGELLGWKYLSWKGVELGLAEKKLSVKTLDWQAPRIHLERSAEGNINLQDILVRETASSPLPVEHEDVADAGERIVAVDDGSAVDETWDIALESFTLSEGQVVFVDRAVSPVFSANLQSIDSRVSADRQAAEVDVKAAVNGYAPLNLQLAVDDLQQGRNGNLLFSLNHLDLDSLSVYSGRYVGWKISQGQLNYDMQLQKNANRLEGKNHLVLEQFAWGEKVESDKLVDAPVKAATALFRGVDGKIALEVPVSGDITEPGFRFGKLLANAFGNLFVKSLASPFTLLASIANTSEDLEYLPFRPGDIEVDELLAERLRALALALRQRPAITLVVQGGYDASADSLQLQRMALRQRMQESGIADQDVLQQNPAWQSLVAELCRSHEAAVVNAEDARETPCQPEAVPGFDDVVRLQVIEPTALHKLSKARAEAIRAFLSVQENIAADRLFMQGDELADYAGVHLKLR